MMPPLFHGSTMAFIMMEISKPSSKDGKYGLIYLGGTANMSNKKTFLCRATNAGGMVTTAT